MSANWVVPVKSWSVGELTTAALINQEMRDRFDYLKTPPQDRSTTGAAIAVIAAAFTDIITLNPITTTGGRVMVTLLATAFHSAAIGAQVGEFDVLDNGVSVSGLSRGVLSLASIGANFVFNASFNLILPPLAAGSHTFKLQARTSGGTFTIAGAANNLPYWFFAREI